MPRLKNAKPKAAKAAAPAKGKNGGRSAEPKEEHHDNDALRKMFDDAAKKDESGPGLKYADVECPHCGEEFEIAVDPQEEGHEMIQDCRACCKPITFFIENVDGQLDIQAYEG